MFCHILGPVWNCPRNKAFSAPIPTNKSTEKNMKHICLLLSTAEVTWIITSIPVCTLCISCFSCYRNMGNVTDASQCLEKEKASL